MQHCVPAANRGGLGRAGVGRLAIGSRPRSASFWRRAVLLVLAACVALPWTVLPAHTAFAEASSYIAGASAAGPWVADPAAPEPTAEAASSPVKVALIDTGVRRDRLPEGASVEPGRNYVFEDKDTTDVVGHGTRIAGIILDIAPTSP